MKRTEDLVWTSESSKKNKYFMLLGIRFVEVCAASLIPSIIGLFVVFINPNARIMNIMNFLSFTAFSVCNWIFWMRYAKQRTNRREFFAINGITYLVYAGISYICYEFTGPFLYSVLFSNLRVFEAFGLATAYSLVVSHAIICILMVICQMYSRTHYTKLLEKLAENGADEIEMDPWGNLVPMQKDREIRILSVEEMHKQMETELEEAEDMLYEEIELSPRALWDKNMVKGRGEKIDTVQYQNIDADISHGDFVAGVGTERDIDNYDVDELWNKGIYKGNTPIEHYDDEPDELPDFFAVNHYEGEENETLWSDEMQQGKKGFVQTVDVAEDEHEDEGGLNFIYYDGEGLWDNAMHQGRGKEVTKPDIKAEAKREFVEIPTENSKYSSDNLWDADFCQGRGKKTSISDAVDDRIEANQNTMEDYDADNLWDNPMQGRIK